jgi:capsular exopolysaccharide synthesis family protein
MQKKTFNMSVYENQAVLNAYEMLTTNIYISRKQNMVKSIVLTSCNPQEGKTTIATSLAIILAHSGWQVLLADANMRNFSTAKRLNSRSFGGLSDYMRNFSAAKRLNNRSFGGLSDYMRNLAAVKRLNNRSFVGLSDYLTKAVQFEEALCETNIANLTYLACGSVFSNPIGLLYSTRFEELMKKVRSEYDFVILDTPALASVNDGLLVASKADAAVLVVKMGKTRLTSIARRKEQLEKLDIKFLGILLNQVKKHDYKKYFEFYNYYQ